MTDPEFAGFLRLLYCQFPSLREWLLAHSPDPERTQQMWCHTLRPYSVDECTAVLAQWADMAETPLKAYSRDVVANLIRATADRNRDRVRQTQQRQRSQQETQAYLDAGGRAIHSNMTATLGRLKQWQRDVTAGTLDEADAQLFIQRALSEVV